MPEVPKFCINFAHHCPFCHSLGPCPRFCPFGFLLIILLIIMCQILKLAQDHEILHWNLLLSPDTPVLCTINYFCPPAFELFYTNSFRSRSAWPCADSRRIYVPISKPIFNIQCKNTSKNTLIWNMKNWHQDL